MNDNIAWEDLLSVYRNSPQEIRRMVGELSDSQLDLAPDEDNWSIREIIHHIVDGDSIWTSFIKQALGEQARPFELFWYWDLTQDEWGKKWAYETRPIEPGLDLLHANREYILSILSSISDISPYSLEIPWPSGEISRWTIRDAIDWNIKHSQNHLDEIKLILDNNS